MKRLALYLIGSSLAALLGCSQILYLSKLGWHQARIASQSVPIEKVLQKDQLDPEAQSKIRFIQEVKAYGEESLGLKKNRNYSTYYEIRGPVLYVVTASEPDQLRLRHWTYPVIGRVTYKGFFQKEGALTEKKKLEKSGYDTYLQPVEAYSTLGWFRDPIFTPMLAWDPGTLANLILHEMTHATVYFKGKTDFNEQMATFIGNQGAVEFLKQKRGAGATEVLRAMEVQEDALLFSRWIERAHHRLSVYYGQGLSRGEILKGREAIFRSLREEYGLLKGRFKTEGHRAFDRTPLNNAVLLAHRQYYHRLETFESLHRHMGGDLRKVVSLLTSIRVSEKDPSAALEQWMKDRGLTVPASPQ